MRLYASFANCQQSSMNDQLCAGVWKPLTGHLAVERPHSAARLLCHLSSPPSLLLPGLLAPLRVVLKEICLASDLCHRLVRCLAQRVRTLWLGE